MDPALVSALSASVAALTAIYATLSAPERERKSWKRNAVVQSAAELRAAYERWHSIETTRLDHSASLNPEQASQLLKECTECQSDARRAEATLHILGAFELEDEAATATSELAMVLFSLKNFVEENPNEIAPYEGYRVCDLENHLFDAEKS